MDRAKEYVNNAIGWSSTLTLYTSIGENLEYKQLASELQQTLFDEIEAINEQMVDIAQQKIDIKKWNQESIEYDNQMRYANLALNSAEIITIMGLQAARYILQSLERMTCVQIQSASYIPNVVGAGIGRTQSEDDNTQTAISPTTLNELSTIYAETMKDSIELSRHYLFPTIRRLTEDSVQLRKNEASLNRIEDEIAITKAEKALQESIKHRSKMEKKHIKTLYDFNQQRFTNVDFRQWYSSTLRGLYTILLHNAVEFCLLAQDAYRIEL